MKGRVFVFGDDIDTDVIAPGGVLHKGMDELIKHSMEAIFQDFHEVVNHGDVVIAGRNFGCGSSREQAPIVLREMGINLVLAKSFSRLFFRNAVNVGLNIGILTEGNAFEDGQDVSYSLDNNTIEDISTNSKVQFEGPSGILREIISDGGLIGFVKKTIKEIKK